MQFWAALFGFLLVAETVPRFLNAHAGVHFKEVLKAVGNSAVIVYNKFNVCACLPVQQIGF